MLFLARYSISAENQLACMERFTSGGEEFPEGVKLIARYHVGPSLSGVAIIS